MAATELISTGSNTTTEANLTVTTPVTLCIISESIPQQARVNIYMKPNLAYEPLLVDVLSRSKPTTYLFAKGDYVIERVQTFLGSDSTYGVGYYT